MGDKVLNYSSPGNGTTQHLTGVMFANQVGRNAQHVPFKGPAEAITALAAGHVDYGFASLASAIPQIKAGRIRGLAVTSAEPAGTPEQVVETLHSKTMDVLKAPEVREKLTAAGYVPGKPMPAGDFQSMIREQVVFWQELVNASGASID